MMRVLLDSLALWLYRVAVQRFMALGGFWTTMTLPDMLRLYYLPGLREMCNHPDPIWIAIQKSNARKE